MKAKQDDLVLKQGDLLYRLYEWSGLMQKDFTKKIDYSEQWFRNAKKWEIIPYKEKLALCRAFSIPMEYWDGKIELPMAIPAIKAEEPQEHYQTKSDHLLEIQKLKDRIIDLHEQLLKAKDEIIELKEIMLADSVHK